MKMYDLIWHWRFVFLFTDRMNSLINCDSIVLQAANQSDEGDTAEGATAEVDTAEVDTAGVDTADLEDEDIDTVNVDNGNNATSSRWIN